MPATDFDRTGKLYRKIDIFYAQGRVNGRLQWHYACSTQQWRLCRDAAQSWAALHDANAKHVKARFA